MNRRSFSRIASLAAVAGLLLSGMVTADNVELRFMWWGSESRHQATLEAIELFQSNNPTIKVKSEYAGWTGYNEKLITAIMGNAAADILQVNWNMLYLLGGKNFLDLKKAKINLANYPQELLAQCTIDKRVVGLPLSTNGRLFYFNKTTYDKAGVPVPQSFTDLISAAKAFKEKLGQGYYPILLEDYSAWLIVLLFTEQKYGKPFIVGNSVTLTVDELKDGFDFYLGLVDNGVTPSISETQTAGVVPYDQEQRWISGYFAGLYEWSSSSSKVTGSVAEGQQVVVGGIPMDYGKKSAFISKISMTYAINAKTKYPKESARFLEFLVSDPNAAKIQKLERGFPSNKAAASVLAREGLLTGIGFEAQQVADKGAGMRISPRFEDPEIQRFYKEEVMQFLGTKLDSKTAAEKVIDKVNRYLVENAD
jgi:oligogalacturonide transport system substrate-binding protein